MREMERGGERERDFSEIMLSDDGILIDRFNIQWTLYLPLIIKPHYV